MTTILANTYTIRYGFIDKKFAKTICQVFKIKSQYLIKTKQIQEFDCKVVKLITHAIYPILTIGIHTEIFALLLIT